MAAKNKENFIWEFGLGNALVFIQTAWKYTSNFQILLNETCFNNELNIHISIYDAEIVSTKKKKQNFRNLKLSKWKKRDTFFSALTYIFERDSKNNVIISNIRFYIRDQIPYICNELYSKDIIELYKKFNFFQLYPKECVIGCQDVFISSQYASKHSFYLNHVGLQNFLGELNINVTTFSKIKIFCNKNQNFDFFVLFLQNYKFHNYKIFSKQAEYNYLISAIQLFTLKNSSGFIDFNFFDYDSFCLEFTKMEQERILTLVRIHFKKVVKQKSNEILIYVCHSKPIKYTGMFIALSFILGRAASALAMQGIPLRAGQTVGDTHPTAAVNFPTPQKYVAPYFSINNTNNATRFLARNEVEMRASGVARFETVASEINKEATTSSFKEFVKGKTKAVRKSMKAILPRTMRPSDASSDSISSTDTQNALTVDTHCKVLGGRLHSGEALSKKTPVNSAFDEIIMPDTFVKFPKKKYLVKRTIYRAQINPNRLKNLSGQSYFVIFYPIGTKEYLVTLCGNVGQAEDLKAVAKLVKDAVAGDKNYKYGGMTFEHGVAHTYNEGLDIGRTDRSNTRDTSYGLTIGDSLNKRMGKTQVDMADVYDTHQVNMFTETAGTNFPSIILPQYYAEYVKKGEERTKIICQENIAEEINLAAQKVQEKHKNYDQLPVLEQEKLVDKACYNAARAEVERYNLESAKKPHLESQKNPYFDMDTSSLTSDNYKKVHHLHCQKVNRYSKELGVDSTQTSTFFFLDVLLAKSQSNLSTEYKSIEYQQPRGNTKKLPCPIENGIQQLDRQSDYSQAVELICKQAAIKWPNHPRLEQALIERKQKLSSINNGFSARAKTNLEMVKEKQKKTNVNYYKKKIGSEIGQEENQEVADNTADTESVVSEITDPANWQKIDTPANYTDGLERKLAKFDNSCEQSRNHLFSPDEQTDYGFIKPENKTLDFAKTHSFLFRGKSLVTLNTTKLSDSCKPTTFVDSFWSEETMKLTPMAARVGESGESPPGPSTPGGLPPGPSASG
jgi:hypothetical protein